MPAKIGRFHEICGGFSPVSALLNLVQFFHIYIESINHVLKNMHSMRRVFGQAFSSFFRDNGFKLSASLSYYTIFSLGPALLIVLSVLGIFFGQDAVQGRIFGQIESLTGPLVAKQIQDILKNIQFNGDNIAGLVTGILILFLGSTGVFTELQDSINYLWSVRPDRKKGVMKFFLNRFISFSLLLGFAFILLVSLIIDSALQAISQRVFSMFPHSLIVATYIINLVMTFFVTASLFCLIFKFLPEAIIRWKDLWKGAFLTAFLFMAGKFAIGYIITHSRISTVYGTATAIIIALTWVYYSAFILFFGAAFTRSLALIRGHGITLKENAVYVSKKESKKYGEV